MLKNRGLSLKGNVENISFMGNISIMLKAYGKTRAQRNFGRSAIPQEKGERSGQENSFKLPTQIQSLFQEGAERGQKKYPSKFSPHVEKAPEFGRQDTCYKSYSSNTLQT